MRAIDTLSGTNVLLNIAALPNENRLAAALEFGEIATVSFVPPTYSDGRDGLDKPTPYKSRIRQTVQDAFSGVLFEADAPVAPACRLIDESEAGA